MPKPLGTGVSTSIIIRFVLVNDQMQKSNALIFESDALTASHFLSYAVVRDGYLQYIQAARGQQELLDSGRLLAYLIEGLESISKVFAIDALEDVRKAEKGPTPLFNIATLQPIKINVPSFERG